MDIKTTPEGPPPQPVIEQPGLRRPASRGWFTVFWVVVAVGLAVIIWAGLHPGIGTWGPPSGLSPVSVLLIGVPTLLFALIALGVHRGLRTGSVFAEAVLIMVGGCVALAALVQLVG